jgi:tetratricopeptide (TPR) repeat protein
MLGDRAVARALFADSLARFETIGDKRGEALALWSLGDLANQEGDCAIARAHLEEAAARFRALGDRAGYASVLTSLGQTTRLVGDHQRAAALFREALRLRWELGNLDHIPECLVGLAQVVGEAEQVARLFGAAEALCERIGAPLPQAALAPEQRNIAATHEQVDEQQFGDAWADGRAMTLEQVISYALDIGG